MRFPLGLLQHVSSSTNVVSSNIVVVFSSSRIQLSEILHRLRGRYIVKIADFARCNEAVYFYGLFQQVLANLVLLGHFSNTAVGK